MLDELLGLRPEIQAICRKHNVWRLEVFGSAATHGFDAQTSDVDFVVTYLPNTDLGPWLSHFFELRSELATLVNRDVDLVMEGAAKNTEFLKGLNQTRRELFAA